MRARVDEALIIDEPDDPFTRILVQLFVGIAGEEGAEQFQVMVYSPLWLEQQLATDAVVRASHSVFVKEYDEVTVTRFLTDLVEQVEGDTWDDITGKLRCIGFWEFEDYQEYQEPAPS